MIADTRPVRAVTLTTFWCAGKYCSAFVVLSHIDPLPPGWRVVPRGARAKMTPNWASKGVTGGGRVAYVCPECAGKVGGG